MPSSPLSMESGQPNALYYKRSHFVTRLPLDRLYSSSHYWLAQQQPGTWRIGLTQFATRMLGEIVDYGFEVQPAAPLQVGQLVGWIEGFKAVSDVFSVLDGQFGIINPELGKEPDAIDRDCYGQGWLYEASGTPDHLCVGVQGYKNLLDATIDKLVENKRSAE